MNKQIKNLILCFVVIITFVVFLLGFLQGRQFRKKCNDSGGIVFANNTNSVKYGGKYLMFQDNFLGSSNYCYDSIMYFDNLIKLVSKYGDVEGLKMARELYEIDLINK